ncbi:Ankyrin-1 [Dactylellina cionopaga]|nr:Ankyrin-1 [Dactylellina cionopaga]
MPSDLQKTFDVALERIQAQPKQHAALALRVLSWLTHARRPLSIEELCHGLAVEPETTFLDDENLPAPKLLINVCGGLVVIDHESGTIRLAHLTVQEYFTNISTRLFGNINVSIAESCVTYLSFDTFSAGVCSDDETLENRLQEHPFLRYSAKHWGDHVRGGGERELLTLILAFLQDRSKADCATQVEFLPQISYHGSYNLYNKGLTAIHIAARWDLTWVLQNLLQRSDISDINARDFDGKTALHHPARLGNEAATRVLIDNGADILVFDDYGRSPLRFAVDGGRTNIVKLLLEKGADINAPVDYHGGTALHWAVRMGRHKIVEILIDHGADLAIKCYDGRTALDYAKENGHDAIAALLSRKGYLVDEEYEQRTAVHRSAREGNVDMVKQLIDQGLSATTLAEGDTSALHLAVLGGHEEVARLLLENGADPLAVAKDGRTILHRAVESGNESVVRLILSYNPELEARDCYGRVPLHWAARMGNVELVKILLEHGADGTAMDLHDRTPLQQAVYGGQEKIVELLTSLNIKK